MLISSDVRSSYAPSTAPIRLFSVNPARISAFAPHLDLERPLTHAHATARGAPCDHDLRILCYPRPSICARPRVADPVFEGVLRRARIWHRLSIRNRHTLALDSRRQDHGNPLMLNPGDDRCARPASASPPSACACLTPCHHLHHLLRAQRAPSSFPIAVAAFIASSRAECVSCKYHSPRSTRAPGASSTRRAPPPRAQHLRLPLRIACAAVITSPPAATLSSAPLLCSKPAPVQHRQYDAQHRCSAQQVQQAFPSAHAAFIASPCAAPILCAHAALRSKPHPTTHRDAMCTAPTSLSAAVLPHHPIPFSLPPSILSAIPPRWSITPPHRRPCAVRRAVASHHQRRLRLPRCHVCGRAADERHGGDAHPALPPVPAFRARDLRQPRMGHRDHSRCDEPGRRQEPTLPRHFCTIRSGKGIA
ncbi:hypothetical protein C8J57DRAFT_1726925 [Mycena rebaudengoi]|nr:hypothetical protein C8J57DRAFT_1726925 [Mycena rebaudengoi]